MFNKEFYPTPKPLVRKMLKPFLEGKSLNGKTILEPSAGKGDILDFIKDNTDKYDEPTIYCIEQNEELKEILKGKNFDVIGNDFLTFNEDLFFDFIIMNPPFSNGDEHLLKAIEIADDTEIICLLNAETILNPCTNRRKLLLQQIKQYGTFEIIDDAFTEAERKTKVQTALVRLKVVKESQKFNFDFKQDKKERIKFDTDFIDNGIARQDTIGNMMLRFEDAKKSYVEFIEARAKFEHYSRQLINKGIEDLTTNEGSPEKQYNHYVKRVKFCLWNDIIKELNLERYMTDAVSRNFNKYIQQQASMSFNHENVEQLFYFIFNNRTNILEQAITDVFDRLTSNYYSENRMYVEGWKTNDRYKINKRIILPNAISFGSYCSSYDLKEYGSTFSTNFSTDRSYRDIDKVLCYITGREFEATLTIYDALNNLFNKIGKIKTGDKFDNTTESEFFEIKIFKKGTMHLKFKDERLWKEFNLRACADKNWLPDEERSKWEQEKKDRAKKRQNDRNGALRISEENNEQSRGIQTELFEAI